VDHALCPGQNISDARSVCSIGLFYTDVIDRQVRCRGVEVYCECRKLVDRANDWLLTNAGLCQLMSCETITWCAVNPDSLGDSEQMALSTSIAPGSKTFHLRGLRSEHRPTSEITVPTRQTSRLPPCRTTPLCAERRLLVLNFHSRFIFYARLRLH